MSSLRNPHAALDETRPLVLTSVTANLNAQLSELNELREQVRKAQLSADKWEQTKTNHQNQISI
jgi:hypothetical protein